MSHFDEYRGRLAPSPTGYLHLGHAKTFWTAQERARQNGGELILRNEDLDRARCKPEFVAAMYEDLRWFGFSWSEGPDIGGSFAPYDQSKRMNFYSDALEKLRAGNFIYPCTCSRRDIQAAASAPHAEDDEPIYPGTCRPKGGDPGELSEPPRGFGRHKTLESGRGLPHSKTLSRLPAHLPVSWPQCAGVFGKVSLRFHVPDGETISFHDENLGEQKFIAGKHFGDFVVWRPDNVPAYQLACVADDAAMQITEVVRGADLLVSTARQILLYRALNLKPPAFFHCGLLRDEAGRRLAKRHDVLSLRKLREQGRGPEELRKSW